MKTRTLAHCLGYLGLLPFLAGTGALFVGDPTISGPALYALSVYSAVILSFMGAVHWGLAMHSDQDAAVWQLGLSVLPGLVAWLALSTLSPTNALVAMAIAFVLMLVADLFAINRSLAPRWYAGLRVPLTAIVCLCLGIAAWKLPS